MKNLHCGALLLMVATFLLGVGCQQENVSAQPGAVSLPVAAQGKVEQALASYDNVRARLAKDDISGIVTDTANLQRAADEAAALTSGAGQSMLKSLAAAARALKDINKSNADEVRKSFGEVSRHVVTLLRAVPTLQAGRFVLHCPMAQGYQKWVQTKAQVDNPYMGTRMLTCGSASDWL